MSRYVDFYLIGELVDSHGNVHYEDLKNLPTADVVEVVRCKDCKHYKIDHPRANGYHCCYRMHSIFPMKPDDFCSYGERRKDGE